MLLISERTLEAVITRLDSASTDASWDTLDIGNLIHEERAKTGVNQKVFMSTLRHALTGMKVRFASFQKIVMSLDLIFVLSCRKGQVYQKS